MGRKVSIVMAYRDRFSQLLFTLKTINLFSRKENFEVIIVDYGSEEKQKANHFKKMFEFPIKVIEIQQKGWVNSCIPLNVAIKQTSGDVVIIQNPECFHCGNIVKYTIEHLNDDNYLTYSCYSINAVTTKKIVEIGDPEQSFGEVQKILNSKQKIHRKVLRCIGWYNHPKVRPCAYHFCSAITKKNIDELGGFDERYGLGFGYDDDELLVRIRRKGLQVVIVPPESGVYAVHQMHRIIAISRGGSPEWRRNKNLYCNVTLKEKIWKANVT